MKRPNITKDEHGDYGYEILVPVKIRIHIGNEDIDGWDSADDITEQDIVNAEENLDPNQIAESFWDSVGNKEYRDFEN